MLASSVLGKVRRARSVWCVWLRPMERSKNRKKKKGVKWVWCQNSFPTICKTGRPTFGSREGSFWLRAYSIAVPSVVFVSTRLLRVQSKPWPQCTIGSKYWQRRLDRVPLSIFFFYYYYRISVYWSVSSGALVPLRCIWLQVLCIAT